MVSDFPASPKLKVKIFIFYIESLVRAEKTASQSACITCLCYMADVIAVINMRVPNVAGAYAVMTNWSQSLSLLVSIRALKQHVLVAIAIKLI